MKKLALFIILIISISSCKKSEWSQADKDRFMRDCVAVDNSDDTKDRCECGLKILMEKYSSMEEAQKATQKMSQEELEKLLQDCSF